MALEEAEQILADLEEAEAPFADPAPRRFKKAWLLASLCLALTLALKLGNRSFLELGASTSLFSDYASLDRYRQSVSDDEDNLVSWNTVMCSAMKDNSAWMVRALAELRHSTLEARCGIYDSALDYAMHEQTDLVPILLKCGAWVTDKMMVQVACESITQRSSRFLELFLDLGRGNVNAMYNGQSPINCAAQRCSGSRVNFLLSRGAFINHKDGRGASPLFNALDAGCGEVAQELIEEGADIMVEGPGGENALQRTCHRCMPNVASLLLQRGIPVNHQDHQGRNALDSAVQYGCVPTATALLNNPYTDVNDVDHAGQTALFLAVTGPAPAQLTKMLLAKGAEVNHVDRQGMTALMLAAQSGKDCELLLNHSADVSLVDHEGNTALCYAAMSGAAWAASSLLKYGAEVNKPGKWGRTPFAMACWNTHAEVAAVLRQHGAKAQLKDAQGQEPISLATQLAYHLQPGPKPERAPQSIATVDEWTARQRRLTGVLKVLVDAKVNLNVYDLEGFTPLTNLLRYKKNQWGVPAQAEAFSQAVQDNANLLLVSGANPNMACRQGEISPLHFCAYNGYPSTARLLLQRGANPHARNKWGKTPAQLCGGGAGQLAVRQMLH